MKRELCFSGLSYDEYVQTCFTSVGFITACSICRERNQGQAALTAAEMKRRGGGGTKQERRFPQIDNFSVFWVENLVFDVIELLFSVWDSGFGIWYGVF